MECRRIPKGKGETERIRMHAGHTLVLHIQQAGQRGSSLFRINLSENKEAEATPMTHLWPQTHSRTQDQEAGDAWAE